MASERVQIGWLTLATACCYNWPVKKNPAAVALGRKGGKTTAKRGPDYFRKIAAMRKTFAGGRPHKGK